MTKDEVKAFNDEREKAGKKRILYPGDPEWDAEWKETAAAPDIPTSAPKIEPAPETTEAMPADLKRQIARTAGKPLK